jgi:hypothetical protein
MLAANPFDCRFLVAWVSVGAALQQQLYDYGYYQIRQQLAPIPAITLLTPYGGKYRQIMANLDPRAWCDTERRRLSGTAGQPSDT